MAEGAVIAKRQARAARPAMAGPRPAQKGATVFGIGARRLVEVAYVVLLGFLLVRLVYVIVTPIEAPPVPAATSGPAAIDADVSVFSRFDPFGSAGPAAPTEESYAGAAETTLDLSLVGNSFGGGLKTATIELPDGRQKAFAVGDEVVGGVTLRDVLPNQAILNRNGLNETLTLKDRSGERSSGRRDPRDLPRNRGYVPPPPQPVTPAITSPGQALDLLSRSMNFAPIEGGDASAGGFALAPGSDPALFQRSGFVSGDIVLAVDGMPAPQDPERLLELMADLPPGRPFTVTVERDGVPLDVPVDLGQLQ